MADEIKTPQDRFEISNPLVIMFRTGPESIQCHIHGEPGLDHRGYGILIADLVRHVADSFNVADDDVWEYVDKERRHRTTDIRRPS